MRRICRETTTGRYQLSGFFFQFSRIVFSVTGLGVEANLASIHSPLHHPLTTGEALQRLSASALMGCLCAESRGENASQKNHRVGR